MKNFFLLASIVIKKNIVAILIALMVGGFSIWIGGFWGGFLLATTIAIIVAILLYQVGTNRYNYLRDNYQNIKFDIENLTQSNK